MKLSKTQIEAIEAPAQERFLNKLTAFLRTNHAGRVVDLDDEQLAKRVRFAMGRARGYGMTWESSTASFVTAMFVFGPDFDQAPAVQRVLTNESVAPDMRMFLVQQLVPDKPAARQRNDAARSGKTWVKLGPTVPTAL